MSVTLRNVLFPSSAEEDSRDASLANDPAFLKRKAERLQALKHTIPSPVSPESHTIQLESHLFSELRRSIQLLPM